MTRRRLAPQQRRAQIVSAAREHIAGQERSGHPGVAKFSLRDIAAAADVSMGTVTYHFAGVNEILSAVVIAEAEEFYSEPVEAARAESDPWQALTELIDPMFAETPGWRRTGGSGRTTGPPLPATPRWRRHTSTGFATGRPAAPRWFPEVWNKALSAR